MTPSNSSIEDPLHTFRLGKKVLSVAARQSSLSKVQALGFISKLKSWYPKLSYRLVTTLSYGDKNKHIPLSSVTDEDFFTREVDLLLLNNSCDIAIHSAKDMPPRPAKNIHIVAVTEGEDPRDILVCKNKTLSAKCIVGCSSERRIQAVQTLYPQAIFKDIRGNIEERLYQLRVGRFDAIVIAQAALQRLNLTPNNIITLPPPHHPLQGKLAITTSKYPQFWRKMLRPFHDNSLVVSEHLHIFDEKLLEETDEQEKHQPL
ncbi:hydroxymethylbilane synthase [Chlamydiifrater phoenicopteri]|uniref:hydroxymethylbilane synthase n=1 Tax=Chlamydiifrater phoenicopteri TaxID=2681469 RepID=UPI001BCCBDB7|nr:hydroxymethylbilane synthase [Chlamydiifrater phoenicopteri]